MHRAVFLPATALGLTFLLAKIALAWRKMKYEHDWPLAVAVSAEDVAVALIMGIVAALLLRATANRPRLNRATGVLLVLGGVVAAFYAVANVPIARTLGFPLNARALTLAGRFADLRSSIAASCTAANVAGLVAAPLAFLLATRWRARLAPTRRPALALLGVALAWVATGAALRAAADPGAWVHRGGRNPHREILGTLAARFLFDARSELVGPFPTEYLDDFKSAAARRHPALPQFPSPPPRNVIMVVLESTAAQYLSLYGSRFDTTPNLVAEARHAMVFDRIYAHVGYTFCARMPLMYSVYPGLPWAYCPVDTRPMPQGLAALMKARGSRTAFFSAADPDYDALEYVAHDAGLDFVQGPTELGGRIASSWGTEDGIVMDALMKWVDADRARPFYAMVWTDQTHHPYTLSADTKPIDFPGRSDAVNADEFNRYLNAIRQADRHVGRLFEFLRARGLADDTLVVITGDHGEAFGNLHDVMGHGGGIYEENLRVPLVLWNPRMFPSPASNHHVGGQVDINPTLAHLLGVTPPPDWQGASLFSPDHPGRVYLQADRSGYQFAVTDGRYKYALYETDGFERLYDLEQDPHERTDVLPEHRPLAAEMRQRISAFVESEERYLNPKRYGAATASVAPATAPTTQP